MLGYTEHVSALARVSRELNNVKIFSAIFSQNILA